MQDKKIIVWFRADLRLKDNPALHHAVSQGAIIPVFIFDEQGAGDFSIGDGSKWWLHHSLAALSDSLDGKLQLYRGTTAVVLEKLIKQFDVSSVYWNRCYEPWVTERDAQISKKLLEQGIDVQTFNGSLLWEPQEILKSDGTPYKVFTAFFKRCTGISGDLRIVISKPTKIKFVPVKHATSVEDLQLLHHNPVAGRFDNYWTPGELQAHKILQKFIEYHLKNYKIGRDFPAQESVSLLSPYLHFGEISPVQIWDKIKDIGHEYASRDNVEHFLKELAWREFAYHVLYHQPTMPRKNLQHKFDHFPWRYDKDDLQAWQLGMTGYPVVDAAMRELFNTGYMHNRMRMVVASFLIKNLMINWHQGEDWFWQLLVDADLASNSFNWQWVAGSGYDAAPYFRVFNPTAQGKKFDKNGEYTRRWLPELAKLPDKYLFEPWLAPENVLREASIVLGSTYPKPMVDIAKSRTRTLGAFNKLK